MSRPIKMTAEVQERVLDATRQGNTRAAAAAAGPVSPSTLYDWLRRGRSEPDSAFGAFAEAMELAELDCQRAVVAMWVAAIPTDWRAAAEFLARRFPDDGWRKQFAVKVTPDQAASTSQAIAQVPLRALEG